MAAPQSNNQAQGSLTVPPTAAGTQRFAGRIAARAQAIAPAARGRESIGDAAARRYANFGVASGGAVPWISRLMQRHTVSADIANRPEMSLFQRAARPQARMRPQQAPVVRAASIESRESVEWAPPQAADAFGPAPHLVRLTSPPRELALPRRRASLGESVARIGQLRETVQLPPPSSDLAAAIQARHGAPPSVARAASIPAQGTRRLGLAAHAPAEQPATQFSPPWLGEASAFAGAAPPIRVADEPVSRFRVRDAERPGTADLPLLAPAIPVVSYLGRAADAPSAPEGPSTRRAQPPAGQPEAQSARGRASALSGEAREPRPPLPQVVSYDGAPRRAVPSEPPPAEFPAARAAHEIAERSAARVPRPTVRIAPGPSPSPLVSRKAIGEAPFTLRRQPAAPAAGDSRRSAAPVGQADGDAPPRRMRPVQPFWARIGRAQQAVVQPDDQLPPRAAAPLGGSDTPRSRVTDAAMALPVPSRQGRTESAELDESTRPRTAATSSVLGTRGPSAAHGAPAAADFLAPILARQAMAAPQTQRARAQPADMAQAIISRHVEPARVEDAPLPRSGTAANALPADVHVVRRGATLAQITETGAGPNIPPGAESPGEYRLPETGAPPEPTRGRRPSADDSSPPPESRPGRGAPAGLSLPGFRRPAGDEASQSPPSRRIGRSISAAPLGAVSRRPLPIAALPPSLLTRPAAMPGFDEPAATRESSLPPFDSPRHAPTTPLFGGEAARERRPSAGHAASGAGPALADRPRDMHLPPVSSPKPARGPVTVHRAAESAAGGDEATAAKSEDSKGGGGGDSGGDVNLLASEVYSLIKRRLATEAERMGR